MIWVFLTLVNNYPPPWGGGLSEKYIGVMIGWLPPRYGVLFWIKLRIWKTRQFCHNISCVDFLPQNTNLPTLLGMWNKSQFSNTNDILLQSVNKIHNHKNTIWQT